VNTSAIYAKRHDTYTPGRQFTGGGATHDVPALRAGATNVRPPEQGYGSIQALDALTGDVRWHFDKTDVTDGGVLSTATGIVFAGGREGYFYALDAATGALLWKVMLGGQIAAGPVTYEVNQEQFVSIPAGNAVFTFGLRR
jgi:outer membrane protein assembly factor BamB